MRVKVSHKCYKKGVACSRQPKVTVVMCRDREDWCKKVRGLLFPPRSPPQITRILFKVDRLQIILVARKYISTCRNGSPVGCLKMRPIPQLVSAPLTVTTIFVWPWFRDVSNIWKPGKATKGGVLYVAVFSLSVLQCVDWVSFCIKVDSPEYLVLC